MAKHKNGKHSPGYYNPRRIIFESDGNIMVPDSRFIEVKNNDLDGALNMLNENIRLTDTFRGNTSNIKNKPVYI